MPLYSRQEAKYLINYYADKMIGQDLGGGTPSVVEMLRILERSEDKYEVYAFGRSTEAALFPRRLVEQVAKDLGLPLPTDILIRKETAKP